MWESVGFRSGQPGCWHHFVSKQEQIRSEFGAWLILCSILGAGSKHSNSNTSKKLRQGREWGITGFTAFGDLRLLAFSIVVRYLVFSNLRAETWVESWKIIVKKQKKSVKMSWLSSIGTRHTTLKYHNNKVQKILTLKQNLFALQHPCEQ